MYLKNDDTICAPATMPGTGAISIIRVSGHDALSIADKVVVCKNGPVSSARGYTIKFGTIYNSDGKPLDEVLVSIFKAPHSYTGENSVEISCHASRYVVSEILRILNDAGCRNAEPGEFTQRAFLNGKMDLAQAEAVADVIASDSEYAHRIAFNQLKGGISGELASMRQQMLKLMSLMELELDFSEEDVEFADRKQLMELVEASIAHISKLSDSFKLGNAIRKGIPVAIIGPANAGKSTLMNKLVNDERAIVSDVPGTTRDTIEETMNLDGLLFRFIDTAGIRESSDKVERIGIERSLKKLNEAEIVILVMDASSDDNSFSANLNSLLSQALSPARNVIIALNKIDGLSPSELDNKNVIAHNIIVSNIDIQNISAKEGKGVENLKQTLLKIEKDKLQSSGDVLVTNLRHYSALNEALSHLRDVRSGLLSSLPGDLLSEDLRAALSPLGSILGEITTDEVLGNIFRNFCVGK